MAGVSGVVAVSVVNVEVLLVWLPRPSTAWTTNEYVDAWPSGILRCHHVSWLSPPACWVQLPSGSLAVKTADSSRPLAIVTLSSVSRATLDAPSRGVMKMPGPFCTVVVGAADDAGSLSLQAASVTATSSTPTVAAGARQNRPPLGRGTNARPAPLSPRSTV